VSAIGTQTHEHVQPTDPPGSDADAWFAALDDRTIELGPATCTARVLGIHTGPDGLWIQLSCEGGSDLNVVVHVTAETRVEDVLQRLKVDPPVGRPLEMIDMHGRLSTPSTARLGRVDASGVRPTPRNAH
jgi:hypothetical protein